jgi:hypothetical protein
MAEWISLSASLPLACARFCAKMKKDMPKHDFQELKNQ